MNPAKKQVLQKAMLAPTPEKQIDALLLEVRNIASFGAGDLAFAQEILDEAMQRSQAIGYQRGIACANQRLSEVSFFRMEYTKAFHYAQQSIDGYEALNDASGLAEMYMGMSMATWDTGNYAKGLDYIFKSLHYSEVSGNQSMGAVTSYMIGSHYYDLKDYADALFYFEQGYQWAKNAGDNPSNLARNIIGLGSVALEDGRHEDAIAYFTEASQIQTSINDAPGLARSYNDLGKVFHRLGQHAKAEAFFEKSQAIRESQPNVTALITTLINFGALRLDLGDYEQAEQMLTRAIALTYKVNAKAKRAKGWLLLSRLCEKLNRWKDAFEHLSNHRSLQQEVAGNDFNIRMRKMELDKKEKEAEIYRLRNVELKDAYERIDKKNQDITASITYAKRIQVALLPSLSAFDQFVDAHFVFYKPRDIVSGDFYFFTEKDGECYVAAVDCTGHGVPGAFMSMIGHNLLNQAIHLKHISSPAAVLAYLHAEVQESLQQASNNNRDGMDMALCKISGDGRNLTFAGAKNPLLLVTAGQLQVIKGDKMPIGGTETRWHHQGFTDHHIELLPDTCCYMATDGYQDQFGGPNNRKFKVGAFRKLLSQNAHLPMSEQRARLVGNLNEWMGNERQIDDILVMGFRGLAS